MKIALRIGAFVGVMALVGLFLGFGPLKLLNQDNRDVSAFNDLVTEFNALQTSTEFQEANAKATALGRVTQDYQAGTINDKLFKKQFVQSGQDFCASLRAYAEKELSVITKPEWPASMETERAALEAYDMKTVEKLKKCESAKSAQKVVKVITEIDASTAENDRLLDAINTKAAEIAKVG